MSRRSLAIALAAACDPAPAAPPATEPVPKAISTAPVPEDMSPPTASAAPLDDARLLAQTDRYLGDPAARRRALERSLRNPTNLYSRTRLGSYGRGELGWDLLPAWNPRVQPVTGPPPTDDSQLRGGPQLWDGQRPTTLAQWQDLGRRVFFLYPLRPEIFAEHALARPDVARAIGLHVAADGTSPGVVRFVDIDGSARVGITCALCHSTLEAGVVVPGRARRDLDYGGMRLAYHRDTGAPVDPELARRMATWGPGRADITEDDDEDPVAIPDLWGLRSHAALTQAATLEHATLGDDAPLALAIRQETQILHANGERTRPPRELAWALALYLYSLTPPARPAPEQTAAIDRGQATFRRDCSHCHSDPGGGGPPIAAADIGTDPALAGGTSRGTGLYRPAPLLRVAEAAPYLHDGTVAALPDLFDPDRLRPGYTRGARGPGPIAGHTPGTELSPAERDDLIAYLHTL